MTGKIDPEDQTEVAQEEAAIEVAQEEVAQEAVVAQEEATETETKEYNSYLKSHHLFSLSLCFSRKSYRSCP